MSIFPKMLQFTQKTVPHLQLLRWSNWLSQCTFDVKHIKGKDNMWLLIFSQDLLHQFLCSPMLQAQTQHLKYSPGFLSLNVPWTREEITRQRMFHEIEVFKQYGGSLLSYTKKKTKIRNEKENKSPNEE